jgi:ABC-type Fe3+ transport system permease subunit
MSIRHLIFLVLLVIVLVGLDLYRTLSTGRARGRNGTITRKGQPDRYRRYVYASCALLALCAVALVWMLFRPGVFS